MRKATQLQNSPSSKKAKFDDGSDSNQGLDSSIEAFFEDMHENLRLIHQRAAKFHSEESSAVSSHPLISSFADFSYFSPCVTLPSQTTLRVYFVTFYFSIDSFVFLPFRIVNPTFVAWTAKSTVNINRPCTTHINFKHFGNIYFFISFFYFIADFKIL